MEKKQKFKERGLVYLSHIPHGFYEVSFVLVFPAWFGIIITYKFLYLTLYYVYIAERDDSVLQAIWPSNKCKSD